MIFVIKLILHEGRRSPAIIWLSLKVSSICSSEISQNVHNLWNLSCQPFKSRKHRGYRGNFLAIWNFYVFSLILKFGSYEYCLSKGTRKGTNMFDGPENLRKFHRRKRHIACSKDPNFLCHKTLRNGIELRQDLYHSMRKLSNLSPFGNLSHGVFSSVDLFFRRRRPMNITGAVARNLRFHHIKTVLC